jgi:small subunit ribosomal protein S6
LLLPRKRGLPTHKEVFVMRKYETFFILDPDLPEEVNNVVDEKLKGVVSSNGGMVLSYTSWGKKKLAYLVKKRSRGHYVLMEYAGAPTLIAELERNMRLDERVLKFVTVKLEENFDPEKEAARLAEAQRAFAEEDAAATAGVSDEPENSEEALEGREEEEEEE